ncbi:DUF4249 domain-containing protein [Hymenobacter sp. BT186]|uniref:DUF4249 domain-containing protein n=1 Tax=Hymenobacter telluris TaxID=2816474 RepID=A0A939EWN9_9BACT|nr:DUF4249 domain-containing protein [Hymenobacter telluris]MBO0359219.1 DUF4249 domain-containing protein [Hymenobacter telluris]MBW3375245.1 DUF4249 domain-containing protein [Hymenobacter norwichensis]
MANQKMAHRMGSLLLGLLVWLTGCIEEYEPDVVSSPESYLVVEGIINLRGVTTVRLSRTRDLKTDVSPPEARATVAIEDAAGTRYALTEQTPGVYTSANLTLDVNRQYRLHLRTAAGREYASDLVTGKLTPPIDQLSWASERNGVQLYVDAHDDTGATRYYRWTYQETWEFKSPYTSEFEFVNGMMRPRVEDISRCWRTENSTTVLQSSTARLNQDVVSKFPLALLPDNSDKLRFKYSILVQQYAQTQEEFTYWERLKRNTESLGTLFDPLPTQLTGNVHSLQDASELVIGYVGASSMTERRLFIDVSELPPGTRFLTGYEKLCEQPDTVSSLVPSVLASQFDANRIPVYRVFDPRTGLILIGYSRAFAFCADCRYRGTNVKPAFWP